MILNEMVCEMTAPALKLANATFAYRHSIPLFEGITLSVPVSQRVALMGQSGVGKSTLLRLMAGLIQSPHGSIQAFGTPVIGVPASIGVMFQKPGLFPWLTLLENVVKAARLAGLRGRVADKAAIDILDSVGIADLADRRPNAVSGGQAQRAALARALVGQPRLLLLDEPFAALDIGTRKRLREDILRIARERELTLILVTHDMADALDLAQRVVVLGGAPAAIIADIAVPDIESQALPALRRALEGKSNVIESADFAARKVA